MDRASLPTPAALEVPAVRLRSATKRYGSFTALDNVSLDIRRGEVFALLGPNGAGKTTLISLVAGIATRTAGQIEVLGRDVETDYSFTRRSVGLVPQEINFDPFFSVEETLRFQAGYFGVRLTEERLVELLSALGLLDKRKANTRALSGGMKRRLLIAKALVHRPSVLFLDEPTAGVDVELRRDLWTYVQRLKAEGTTVVLTTHYLEEAEALADRVAVIKGGKLLVVESKDALMRRFGRRTVRLSLEPKATELPEGVRLAGGTLAEGGAAVTFDTPTGASLAAPLQAVASAGMRVIDVQSREARLEDVLVELLHAPPAAAPAPELPPNLNERSFMDVPAPPPSEKLLGATTLFKKEVTRFLRVPGQTLLSPLITTALYFLVFGYSLGGRLRLVDGVPYVAFLVPGLVMLGIISNSFLNTSSSLFILKMQGTIVDLLVTPLAYFEILGAFVAAALVRAMLVGGMTWATAALFAGPEMAHPLLALLACMLVAVAFASMGLCVAIWADKFEQVNFVPTFVITPLTFLGGVFYSATMLPPALQGVLHANPIYYMIELVRFALLGTSASSPWVSGGLIALFAAAMGALALQLLKRGYKLRS